MIRAGSVFSGSGMLDVAVHSILGADPAWFCEYEPPTFKSPKPSQGAAKVLAHHWPDVPNLGDITEVDWTAVEPVEILTGGFPCQSVSAAGKRAGLRPGTRSGLWSYMRYAISQLRPELVVIENVRGLLSADADCDLERCTWCLGNDAGRPMRALGCVLGDLASLGYDAEWYGLRAADVGAPHGRFRIFIAARPASTNPIALGFGAERRYDGFRTQRLVSRTVISYPNSVASEGRSPAGLERETGPATGSTPDLNRFGQVRSGGSRRGGCGPSDHGESTSNNDCERLERGWPIGSQGAGGRRPEHSNQTFAADAPSGGESNQSICGDESPQPVGTVVGTGDRPRSGDPTEGVHELGPTPTVMAWGPYEPAIRRWERILGRPAPPPTRTGTRGGQQLSAEFCEWLMGWPKGWVTEVPGLSRNDMIKIAGNGVVPHQAAEALRHLLSISNGAAE